MKKGKNEAGITLIALTITIIVLLILAGVTISALSGDNGILQNATRAKEETEQAEKDEKEKLGNMEDTINEYVTGIEVEQVTDENPGALEGEGTDDKAIGIEGGNVTKNNIEEVSDIKDMPTILSIINTENCFKEDTNNINKGYPILNWQ